jgi:hypothetical protein
MLHAWNAICDESLVMEEFVRIRMENSEIKVTLMEITRVFEKRNPRAPANVATWSSLLMQRKDYREILQESFSQSIIGK